MSEQVEALADATQAFRAALQEGGFEVANAPGELVLDPIWISTGYSHNEITVAAWFRFPGDGGRPQHRWRFRFTPAVQESDPNVLEHVAADLIEFHRLNQGQLQGKVPGPNWPPHNIADQVQHG